ncbi:hypothetical protein ACLOJK_026505 [Asimina triloba]
MGPFSPQTQSGPAPPSRLSQPMMFSFRPCAMANIFDLSPLLLTPPLLPFCISIASPFISSAGSSFKNSINHPYMMQMGLSCQLTVLLELNALGSVHVLAVSGCHGLPESTVYSNGLLPANRFERGAHHLCLPISDATRGILVGHLSITLLAARLIMIRACPRSNGDDRRCCHRRSGMGALLPPPCSVVVGLLPLMEVVEKTQLAARRKPRSLSNLGSLFVLALWLRQIRHQLLVVDFLDGSNCPSDARRWWVYSVFGGQVAAAGEDADAEDGLRSKRIRAPCLVTKLLGDSDLPSGASQVMILPSMGKMPCYCCRDGEDVVGVNSSMPDLEELVVAVILPSPDRPLAAAGEDRQTAAMATVVGGGDRAPYSCASAVHDLRCTYSANYVI